MEGFYNIDKPAGISSYDVIRHLKKFIKSRKIGHSGNLDPGATGVLIIGVGRATRLLEYITDLEKEYTGSIKLGVLTDTLDADGEILMRKEVPELNEETIKEVFKEFTGEIEQTPPAYSAIRIKGKRLYELAREGVMVTPKKRKVKIYKLDLLGLNKDSIEFRAIVSRGTYLRSLARDIAEKLGTLGIIERLRRVRIGPFTIEDSTKLDDIRIDNYLQHLIPIKEGLSFFPAIYLSERAAEHFRQGNMVSKAGIIKKGLEASAFSYVRVFDNLGNFIGVGFLKWEGIIPKKVLP